MTKSDLINSLMRCFGIGMTRVRVGEWTFTFDPFTGYGAATDGVTYSSFDDLAGMVEDMFEAGCFDE